jgi:hypothetical protein
MTHLSVFAGVLLMLSGGPGLSATGVAASASSASAAQDQDIVVEGTRQSDKQIRDYVSALTAAPAFGQIGRFYDAVCPVAIGLPTAQRTAIVERMRLVSAAANIRVAPTGCTPNVFVIVAPDRQAAIRFLAQHYPAYFSGMSARQIARLAATPSSASAWQISTRLSADGQILKKGGGTGFYILENSNAPSRVKAATIPAFVASVVVIDLQAAAGLTVTQLADYATMRTLADTMPSRAAGVAAPSILTILDKAPDQLVPLTLSHWDLAYLKALYDTSNAYYAAYQRGDIEQVVGKELRRPAPRERR